MPIVITCGDDCGDISANHVCDTVLCVAYASLLSQNVHSEKRFPRKPPARRIAWFSRTTMVIMMIGLLCVICTKAGFAVHNTRARVLLRGFDVAHKSIFATRLVNQ